MFIRESQTFRISEGKAQRIGETLNSELLNFPSGAAQEAIESAQEALGRSSALSKAEMSPGHHLARALLGDTSRGFQACSSRVLKQSVVLPGCSPGKLFSDRDPLRFNNLLLGACCTTRDSNNNSKNDVIPVMVSALQSLTACSRPR